MSKAILERLARLEAAVGTRQASTSQTRRSPRRRSGSDPRRAILADIDNLERQLEAGRGWMDMDEELIVEPGMGQPGYMDMDDDASMGRPGYMDLDDDLDADLDDDDLPEMGDMTYMDMDMDEDMVASEVDPNGIEEQITQDSLTQVEDLRGAQGLATEDSMEDAARVGADSDSEYIARLTRASKRLGRVAAYLEKHGRIKFAYRIDQMADAVDEKIKGERI